MKKRIVSYFTHKQVLEENIALSTSKSPLKPKLVMEELLRVAPEYLAIVSNFKPFTKEDFLIAHTKEWVDTVFHFNRPGQMLASSIPWSEELVSTLTYTSSSLYNAIKHSIDKPEDICFSATSGFHHAAPTAGSGFCTFAGQVIASTKIYRETGKVGCYLDLDGHFGNSIGDCRSFVPDLDKAIPFDCNFNPKGQGKQYVEGLNHYLYNVLAPLLIYKKVDYVVWCHGADSHYDDDFGGQVETEQWVQCSEIFWNWVNFMKTEYNIDVPISFALFGGYRKDDYASVISLHMSDIVCGINTCIEDADVKYELVYTKPKPFNSNFY